VEVFEALNDRGVPGGLATSPARGCRRRIRVGSPDAADQGGGAVAVLSHRLWQEAFGGSRDAIGATLRIAGTPVTVVGVAPPGFRGLHLASARRVAAPEHGPGGGG
jgi:hypothetical protein